MSLPRFFCVENRLRYKVYANCIYKSSATLDTEVSVIWPQENIDAGTMTIKLRNDHEKSTTYRKWNGNEYKMISWSFTGSSIDMTLNDREITIVCPVIQVSDKGLLPFNTCSIIPSREIFQDEEERSNYERAVIFQRDPNSPEYFRPFPQREPVPMAVHMSVAVPMAVHMAVPVPVPVPMASNHRKSLPPHVASIVLADAISKNEICPISSEAITIENGSVTSCGHVFCKDSIDQWLSISASRGECPVCKQTCS
jgi:hypothetical protein